MINGFHTSYDGELTKETSIYYELLVKKHGKKFANYCWEKRKNLEKEDSLNDIYLAVKKYKPRDPLCLIGDLNWGYSKIEKSLDKL